MIWVLLAIKNDEVKGEAILLETKVGTLARSFKILPKLLHKSLELGQSAVIAATKIYDILCREGNLPWAIKVDYKIITSDNPHHNTDGGSAGLAFALGLAMMLRHQQPYRPIAATGIVNLNGRISNIGELPQKIEAALTVMPLDGGLILYPVGNEKNIPDQLRKRAQQQNVKLIGVADLYEALQSIGIKLRETTNKPFLGLRAYQYEDRGIFFGRDVECNEIVEKLLSRSLSRESPKRLMVLGSSGSGKSSLVQAGVIPKLQDLMFKKATALRWSTLPPSQLLTVQNEEDLLKLLAQVCISSRGLGEQATVPTDNTHSIDLFLNWMNTELNKLKFPTDLNVKKVQYLWVVDQLEELFTQNITKQIQGTFVDILRQLNNKGQWVLLTMRNDFVPQFQATEPLRAWVNNNTLYLPEQLYPGAVEQIVLLPAKKAGCEYEFLESTELMRDKLTSKKATNDEGERVGGTLATRIIHDVGNDKAILPLLSFTLQQLYESALKSELAAKNRCIPLTHHDYRNIGGLHGAIGKKADEVYVSLPEDVQATLPRVIRALTHITEQGITTARATLLSEFAPDGPERKLIDAFVKERLFVVDGQENIQQLTME